MTFYTLIYKVLVAHWREYYATYNQRLIEILPDHWKSSGVHMNRYYLKAAWYFKERKLACSLYKGHVKSSMKNFRVKYGKKNCASKQCPLSSIFTLYPCDGHGILSNIFPTVRISFLFFFFFFFFFLKNYARVQLDSMISCALSLFFMITLK